MNLKKPVILQPLADPKVAGVMAQIAMVMSHEPAVLSDPNAGEKAQADMELLASKNDLDMLKGVLGNNMLLIISF